MRCCKFVSDLIGDMTSRPIFHFVVGLTAYVVFRAHGLVAEASGALAYGCIWCGAGFGIGIGIGRGQARCSKCLEVRHDR